MANKLDDSKTKVHFSNYIKSEWKDGERLPITIRINNKLYEEFKPISKALYGSTCNCVENLMAAIVLATRNKVHFSNTMNPIKIGKIVIERNLRPRRKMEIEGDSGFCGFEGCRKGAVGSGVYLPRDEPYQMCVEHLEVAKDNPKDWKVGVE